MEEKLFKALSDLLNLCIWEYPTNIPFLPDSKIRAGERQIENSNIIVGNLVYQLDDIGVIANTVNTTKTLQIGGHIIVKYDQAGYLIITKQKLEIRGIIFTPLGDSIAKFFNPEWNSGGASVLKDWIDSIPEEQAEVKPVNFPQSQ